MVPKSIEPVFPITPVLISNKWRGRRYGPPDAIVIHTMDGSVFATDHWFQSPLNLKSSAHYGVGLVEDAIHEYVDIRDTAWGNGILETGNHWPFSDGINPNWLTISIETEGKPDTPVTDSMFDRVVWICQQAISEYPSIMYLMTHSAISPISRPRCPGPRWTEPQLYTEEPSRLAALASILNLRVIV